MSQPDFYEPRGARDKYAGYLYWSVMSTKLGNAITSNSKDKSIPAFRAEAIGTKLTNALGGDQFEYDFIAKDIHDDISNRWENEIYRVKLIFVTSKGYYLLHIFRKKKTPLDDSVFLSVLNTVQTILKETSQLVRRVIPLPSSSSGPTPFQLAARNYEYVNRDSENMLYKNQETLKQYGVIPSYILDIESDGVKNFFLVQESLKSNVDRVTFFGIRYKNVGQGNHIIGAFVTQTHIVLLHHWRHDAYDARDAIFRTWLTSKGIEKQFVVYPPDGTDYNLQRTDKAVQGLGACQRWWVMLPYLVAKDLVEKFETMETNTTVKHWWNLLGTDWNLVKPVYDEIQKNPMQCRYELTKKGIMEGIGRKNKTRRQKKRATTRRR